MPDFEIFPTASPDTPSIFIDASSMRALESISRTAGHSDDRERSKVEEKDRERGVGRGGFGLDIESSAGKDGHGGVVEIDIEKREMVSHGGERSDNKDER